MTTPDLSQVRERPVRTAVDLENLWRAMMGEGGFGRRTLWLAFLDAEGRLLPVIIPVEDIPRQPERDQIGSLAMIIDQLVLDDRAVEAVVLLLSRPGTAAMTAGDRAWARAVAPLSEWPIHLATADRIQVFAPDDLVQIRP